MSYIFFSAAGPHAIINGKEVVNFASANYLGLIGHEKLLVRTKEYLFLCNIFSSMFMKNFLAACFKRAFIAVFYLRIHVPLRWKNTELVPVVLVVSMEQLV